MAEDKDESQEKTQDPSSRKIEKAREDGKVVTSKEMYVFTILFVGKLFNFNALIAKEWAISGLNLNINGLKKLNIT